MSIDDPALERCKRVYAGEAEAYDRLVSAEDCDGNLLPAIRSVVELNGASLLDVGSGTGRVARLLAPHVGRVANTDQAFAMLKVARKHLSGTLVAQSDARQLPYPDETFDLATAGWVFGHLTFWDAGDWQNQIGAAIDEMQRVLRPSGHAIVFETMGTATERPSPPGPSLEAYYTWLANERGFQKQVLPTDFGFESVDAAAESCGFFFGPEFADRIRERQWARVPEWTGMWSRRFD